MIYVSSYYLSSYLTYFSSTKVVAVVKRVYGGGVWGE